MAPGKRSTEGEKIVDLSEFDNDAGKAPATKPVIRESFRIPAGEHIDMEVVVNGKIYKLVDIGTRGIGIALDNPDVLPNTDDLHDIQLRFEDEKLELKGMIVHISPDTLDTYLCGIELVEIDVASEKKLHKYLQKFRSGIFSDK